MSHEKVLEVARVAVVPWCNSNCHFIAEAAVSAYLSALVPDEVAGVVERLNTFVAFVRNAPVSSGVCCCGEDMANHAAPMSCGHSPVDQWDYSLSEHLRSIASIPSTLTALAARAEKAEREQDIWPEWAAGICKCLRDYGVEPSDEEGWDLPAQFEDWIQGVVENETARITTLEAENAALRARLEEALKPFAQSADWHEKIHGADCDDGKEVLIRMAHLRRARALSQEGSDANR